MEHQDGDSLDLLEIVSEPQADTGVREAYRIPLSRERKFTLVIDNVKYPVLDISQGGIRIAVDATSSLASQGELLNGTLIINEKIFSGLSCQVVHYSLDSVGNWICGIRWQELSDSTRDDIDELVQQLKIEQFGHE